MATSFRRAQRSTNIWPGFVDALSNLILVLTFVLVVFVVAQFALGEALSGRDTALRKLQDRASELAELLALERKASQDLRLNVSQLSQDLAASVAARDELNVRFQGLTSTLKETQEASAARAREAAQLAQEIEALKALRDELAGKVAAMADKAETSEKALIEERKVSESARAQVALLNRQMAALREQMARLNQALEASEAKNKEQNVQITSLGQRLNAALATKVQELSRYRSEFFGRLREVLGNHPGIRIVGDRFVFQSELLFETASADVEPQGQEQLDRLAATLLDLSRRIPPDIDWILRVDGHTDRVPIATARFPSNWELSTARAISVVRYLIARGLPPSRLAATGFGEYQPLDDRDDEIARRRNRRIELKLTER